MLTDREYQPSLLWAYAERWAQEQGATRNSRLRLYIYRTDRAGAYYLRGPRLYWDPDLGDDSFFECDQDALWEDRAVLAEVVAVQAGNPQKSTLLGRSYAEAFRRIAMQPEAA